LPSPSFLGRSFGPEVKSPGHAIFIIPATGLPLSPTNPVPPVYTRSPPLFARRFAFRLSTLECGWWPCPVIKLTFRLLSCFSVSWLNALASLPSTFPLYVFFFFLQFSPLFNLSDRLFTFLPRPREANGQVSLASSPQRASGNFRHVGHLPPLNRPLLLFRSLGKGYIWTSLSSSPSTIPPGRCASGPPEVSLLMYERTMVFSLSQRCPLSSLCYPRLRETIGSTLLTDRPFLTRLW